MNTLKQCRYTYSTKVASTSASTRPRSGLPFVTGMNSSSKTDEWPYCLSFADMIPKHELNEASSRPPSVNPGKLRDTTKHASSLDHIEIQFLGTASSIPTPTRGHNSLALRLDKEIWMFDVGESTQLQMAKSPLKAGRINTIFITHLHGDHVFGLGPLVCSLCQGFGTNMSENHELPSKVSTMDDAPIQLEIYGPLGTRAYLRSALRYSYSFTSTRWRVHELLLPGEKSLDAAGDAHHPCEVVGQNLLADVQNGKTVFRDILVHDDHRQKHPFVTVSAAPIRHTVPTLGFVLEEKDGEGSISADVIEKIRANPGTPMSVLQKLKKGETVKLPDGTVLEPPAKMPGRKLCILGDTCDPSNISTLAKEADVLVHEATNALVTCDPNTKDSDTYETVRLSTVSHGHSTPQMAGEFARSIEASNLILNHFSARYRGDSSEASTKIMEEIRALAQERYPGRPVYTARDWTSFTLTKSKELKFHGTVSKYAT